MTALPKIFLVANKDFQKSADDGDFIPKEKADKWIANFRRYYGTCVCFKVLRTEIQNIVEQVERHFVGMRRFDPGLRLYVGKKENNYSIIAVPIASRKRPNGKPRKHEKDLEATHFEFKNAAFFAFNISKEGVRMASPGECKELLEIDDESGVKVVFYSIEGLKRFLAATTTATTVRFTFARLKRAKKAKLTLILSAFEGEKIVSFTLTTKEGERSFEGVYFDRADLIPPPPKDDTLVDDSSFE